MQAETKFKMVVMRDLLALDGVWFVKTQMLALRGVPDILLCLRGRFAALELKRHSAAPVDKLQIHTLNQIEKAGGFAAVVYPEIWPAVFTQLRAMLQS